MKTILVINATTNKETSHTYYIYKYIIKNLDLHGYEIKELNLYEMNIPFLDYEMVESKDNKTYTRDIDKEVENIALEFCHADGYIFIAPTWNLNVPGIFKAYIDLICDSKKVFAFIDKKRVGLLKGKKVIIINTCGGTGNYAIDYMVNISEFMGLEHQEYFIPKIATKYKNKPYELMVADIIIDSQYFQ